MSRGNRHSNCPLSTVNLLGQRYGLLRTLEPGAQTLHRTCGKRQFSGFVGNFEPGYRIYVLVSASNRL